MAGLLQLDVISLDNFILSILIIGIGFFGMFIHQNNIMLFLVSMELIYLGIVLLYLFIGANFDDSQLQVFSFFIIVVVSLESVVMLGMIINLFKYVGKINMYTITYLHG